jgi:hypothetical protein
VNTLDRHGQIGSNLRSLNAQAMRKLDRFCESPRHPLPFRFKSSRLIRESRIERNRSFVACRGDR